MKNARTFNYRVKNSEKFSRSISFDKVPRTNYNDNISIGWKLSRTEQRSLLENRVTKKLASTSFHWSVLSYSSDFYNSVLSSHGVSILPRCTLTRQNFVSSEGSFYNLNEPCPSTYFYFTLLIYLADRSSLVIFILSTLHVFMGIR